MDVAQSLKNTISMRYLSEQIYQLDMLGFGKVQCLSFLNLNQAKLDNAVARIGIPLVEDLYRHAAKVLDDPDLGLRVGHNFRIVNYAQTGTIYTLCKNIRQSISLNAKYQRIAVDAGEISYDTIGINGRPGHFLSLAPYEEVKTCYHVLNMICGAYATTFNWLGWGVSKDLKSVCFNQSKPDDMSLFDQLYDCPVFFDQPKVGIEFYEAAMNTPLPTRDDEKLSLGIAKLDQLLKADTMSESLEIAVRASIRGALTLGQVSLPIIASRLNFSERDLRKILKSSGLKYRELLDLERQTLFKELHEKGESFSVISQELCYNDQAAFNRAVKRWYGVSPSQYVKFA